MALPKRPRLAKQGLVPVPLFVPGVPLAPGNPPEPLPLFLPVVVLLPLVTVMLVAEYVLPLLVTATLTGVPSFRSVAAKETSWEKWVELE